MKTPLQPIVLLVAATLVLAAPDASAQTYRCVGKDGKKYYGQTLPPQCLGMPVEVLNSRGRVIKRIDEKAEAAERAAKEAEAKKKAEEEAARREERRRNRALFATYATVDDIESARRRALEDNRRAVKQIEMEIVAIKKRQARNAKEMEFYAGKNKPPARLEQDIKNAEIDLNSHYARLEAKKGEVGSINAKYDEDKRRFIELTGGK